MIDCVGLSCYSTHTLRLKTLLCNSGFKVKELFINESGKIQSTKGTHCRDLEVLLVYYSARYKRRYSTFYFYGSVALEFLEFQNSNAITFHSILNLSTGCCRLDYKIMNKSTAEDLNLFFKKQTEYDNFRVNTGKRSYPVEKLIDSKSKISVAVGSRRTNSTYLRINPNYLEFEFCNSSKQLLNHLKNNTISSFVVSRMKVASRRLVYCQSTKPIFYIVEKALFQRWQNQKSLFLPNFCEFSGNYKHCLLSLNLYIFVCVNREFVVCKKGYFYLKFNPSEFLLFFNQKCSSQHFIEDTKFIITQNNSIIQSVIEITKNEVEFVLNSAVFFCASSQYLSVNTRRFTKCYTSWPKTKKIVEFQFDLMRLLELPTEVPKKMIVKMPASLGRRKYFLNNVNQILNNSVELKLILSHDISVKKTSISITIFFRNC